MNDKIPKYIQKLHSDIRNKEDKLDKMYDKIHKAEEDLAAMRRKRSLMKITFPDFPRETPRMEVDQGFISMNQVLISCICFEIPSSKKI